MRLKTKQQQNSQIATRQTLPSPATVIPKET